VDDPPDAALADTGRKLVGANGGFACVSCHGVGEFGATQVFEAPGINLAKSFARLQPDFFRRWLRNPPALDPNSKMPAYFDEEGRSALADVLDGDGPKTIRAVWEYLRLGDKMPPPQ
jgi:mono/diheme cytochrome c family protein